MTPIEQAKAFATYANVISALELLVATGLLENDDRMRLAQKFMADRPELRRAVEQRLAALTGLGA